MNPLMTTIAGHGSQARHGTTALSVNLNKIALLRNTRASGMPSVTRAAAQALEAGAQGITVHPRPDERHIRPHDVHALAALLAASWPQVEFNIEGNPFHNLMDILRDIVMRGMQVHQCTFVPDGIQQSTSDHGWQLPQEGQRLAPLIAEAQKLGVRVSLFMDPFPEAMPMVRALGADRVELYTETYARAHGTASQAEVARTFTLTAEAALREGLGINAGHDLNRTNLTEFLQLVPGVQEVSIGHALIADALELGLSEAVRDYLCCIHRAAAKP